MAWSSYQKILALLMVITGSFNTLSVKYADNQEVPGQDEEVRKFSHPFMQSLFMFFGEMLCFFVFKIALCYCNRFGEATADFNNLTKGNRLFNPFILFAPSACDMLATSIMYVGLTLTSAGSFQMLRGAVIIFTGLLSVGFLNRKLDSREWIGIILVCFGIVLVGLSDVLVPEKDSKMGKNAALTGDLLIITAQIITAIQMVIEEKFIVGQDIPALQAVGWEGIFGFFGMILLIIPLNYIQVPYPFANNSMGTLEATVDALVQIKNSGRLLMAVIGIMLSIAFFNFSGVSVTKELSATTRMILDSIRTIVIWIFSLACGWQTFHYLQLLGFIILFIGMACYNNVIIPQLVRKIQHQLGRHNLPCDEERVINTAADDLEERR